MTGVQTCALPILIKIRDRRARMDERSHKHSPWEGDWVTNFNWLKHDTLFERIPRTLDSPFPGELMDFQYYRVTPNHVLTGWSPDRDFDDIFNKRIESRRRA